MIIKIDRLVSVTSVIYVIFMFAFVSGSIHAIIEGERGPQQVFLIPDRSTQTMAESVLSTMIFLLGVAGLYMIHRSSRPQTAKVQKLFFIAGFSIISISLLGVYLLIGFKL